jgi:hypothetical protein
VKNSFTKKDCWSGSRCRPWVKPQFTKKKETFPSLSLFSQIFCHINRKLTQ